MRYEVSSVRPDDFTDVGNAKIFQREFKDDLLYTDSLGWLWWNGKRWEENDHKPTALAVELTDRMKAEAIKEQKAALDEEHELKKKEIDGDGNKKLLEKARQRVKSAQEYTKHAMKSRSAPRLEAMLRVAKPGFVIPGTDLDHDGNILNTQSGIVHLPSGWISPHRPEMMCAHITNVGPSSENKTMWEDFLHIIFQNNPDVENFVQCIAGMALYGTVYVEGAIFAVGHGRNGKSTFFNALSDVLGDYSGGIDIDNITTKQGNTGAELATLRGKRLVIAGELEQGRRLSVSTVKKITSTDSFMVSKKFKDPETIKPSHTLCMFTNFLPKVSSTDEGTWRRIIVVPFKATIPKESGITNYGQQLVARAGGAILQWAIDGAKKFAANQYKLPDFPEIVREATEEYRRKENWLNKFLLDRCEAQNDSRVQARELYLAYRKWASELGEYAHRENEFNSEMEKLGYQSIKPKNRKFWLGIALIEIDGEAGNRWDNEVL